MTYLDKCVQPFDELGDQINIDAEGLVEDPITKKWVFPSEVLESFLLTSLKEYGAIREKEGRESVKVGLEKMKVMEVIIPQASPRELSLKVWFNKRIDDLLSTLTPDEI